MTQKDLADEYAEKEYHRVNGDDAPCFTDEPCFNFDDIRYAFNAGRESVVENMPKLKWSKAFEDGLYIAISSFGVSYRIKFAYNEFHLFCVVVVLFFEVCLKVLKRTLNFNFCEVSIFIYTYKVCFMVKKSP